MSANRTIPYGYAVVNGQTVIHPAESEIVRRIFTDYIGGASLLNIARALAAGGVEYLPGHTGWNKNRVGRILEDARYPGAGAYPAIISADTRRQALAAREPHNNQADRSGKPGRLPCPVECALCGAKMARRHDARRRAAKELWTCQNPDCGQTVNIDGTSLHGEVAAILNRLIAGPSLVRADTITDTGPAPELRRLANEAERQLGSFEFDRDRAQAAAFSLAAGKYRQIDSRPYLTRIVRAVFENNNAMQDSEPTPSYIPAIFKCAVSKVLLGDGGVRLMLKNGQVIGKEGSYADINIGGNSSDDTAGCPTG